MKNEIITKIPEAVQKIFKTTYDAVTIVHKEKIISPHIKHVSGLIIENLDLKRDYITDIKILRFKYGIPVSSIAETLSMSPSYVYKLLKK